jgi:serine/threonine protein kinase
MVDEKGLVPPELRSHLQVHGTAQQKAMNFQTDIFQLGLILWLLAENRPNAKGYFCKKYACSSVPRYNCSAHSNPVALPISSRNIPSWFAKMINQCRLPDPIARPTACRLANLVRIRHCKPEVRDLEQDIPELLDTYSGLVARTFAYCDECGITLNDVYYHCNTCALGNFDLCLNCVAQGIQCLSPEHQLMKLGIKDGRFVGIS